MHKRDSAAAAATVQPRTLFAETPHFLLRTLDTTDARANACAWQLDPATQANLNAPAKRYTISEFRSYIASFDRVNSHAFGIFAKDNGQLVGMRAVYINWPSLEVLVNTLIGEVGVRGKGAQRETRYAMYQFLFEDLGLESALASVVADNAYMLQNLLKTGWVHERTAHKPSATGQGLVELRLFRLTREVWRAGEAAKAKAFCDPPPA
jgi:RimJ/RimL family protein N-acetyltransferase